MIERHAKPPHSTKAVFREAAADARIVVESFESVLEWLRRLDIYICLPDF